MTQISTVLPTSTTVPPTGACFHTRPARVVSPGGGSPSSVTSTTSPAPSTSRRASAAANPSTLGTAVVGGGSTASVSVTVSSPRRSTVPPGGDCRNTTPGGYWSLGPVSVSMVTPLDASTRRASASRMPTTDGSRTPARVVVEEPSAAARASASASSTDPNEVAGRSASAAPWYDCQISAGQVPPVTVTGVVGGTIEVVSPGKPTHTAVLSSGV